MADLYLDDDVAAQLAALLHARGHRAQTVGSFGLATASDDALLLGAAHDAEAAGYRVSKQESMEIHMPFNFRRVLRFGPFRVNVGKRGVTSVGIGRVTKSWRKTPRVTIPTGIRGLSFRWGGKPTRKRR